MPTRLFPTFGKGSLNGFQAALECGTRGQQVPTLLGQRPLQNLRFERISKIASHNAQIILKYFQALEKRIAKKCAKDEDFAKVSAKERPAKSRD